MVIQQVRENGLDFLMMRHEGDFFNFVERLLNEQGFKVIEASLYGLKQERSN